MNINITNLRNTNYIIIFFILLYNLYIRFITFINFSEYEKIFILFLFVIIVISTLYVKYIKTIITFSFGSIFFLFGFRPYDIQSQIFEALVLFITILYFINILKNNNYIKLNKYPKYLFILLVILSIGSCLLLPAKYILYNFINLGNEWYFSQIINAIPNSFYYPLNGINRLILFCVFSIVMAQNSLKTFRILFLGLFFGGVLCSVLGLLDYYGIFSLKWYSQTVTERVLSSTFMNRGWLSEYLLLITPFILILFITIKALWIKIILFLTLILLELTLILSAARAGWVSYPLVLLFCWIFLYFIKDGKVAISKIKWHSYLKIIASVPITILISIVVLFYVIIPLTEINRDNPNTQSGVYFQNSKDLQNRARALLDSGTRKKAWMQGIDAGMESPVYGMGYDSFAWHTSILSKIPESIYSKYKFNKFSHLHETPHNFYITLFVNGGMIGILIWLIFILMCLTILLYDLIKNHNLTNIPVLICIVIFHTYGIFQSMQYVPMIWFFIFICIAYCLRISNEVIPVWLESIFSKTNKFVLFLVIIGIVTYIYNSESEHLARRYQLAKYENDQKYDQYMGFYPEENWNGEAYRWTGKNARIKLNHKGKIEFKMQFHNVRPDLTPVKAKISVDGEFIETVTFSGKSNVIIKDIILDLGDSEEEKILSFSISRTWSPKNYGSNDKRVIGVAISEIKSINI